MGGADIYSSYGDTGKTHSLINIKSNIKTFEKAFRAYRAKEKKYREDPEKQDLADRYRDKASEAMHTYRKLVELYESKNS